MTEPLISIIVPVYNVEPYLKKCVDSLLSQTYKNLEIILVDDGSPDKCPGMCNEYAETNNNVIVLHKQNGGQSSARNLGVQKANGKYIAFVDSDDYVEPGYISDMWDMLNTDDADIAITRVQREYENNSRAVDSIKFEKRVLSGEEAFFAVYFTQIIGWQPVGKLYKKDILIEYPFPDGYYEDFAILYKILLNSERVAVGDHINNYHYICRNGSSLRQKFNDKHYRVFDVCDEIADYVSIHYPEERALPVMLYKSAVTQILNLMTMDRKTYREIYAKYKNYFKKNYYVIKKDKRISRKNKLMIKLLGGSSTIYRLAMRINGGIKR